MIFKKEPKKIVSHTQSGFALMEVLVSIAILTIVIFGLMASNVVAIKQQKLAAGRAEAFSILQEVITPVLYQKGNFAAIQASLSTGWPKTVTKHSKQYNVEIVSIKNYDNTLIANAAAIAPTDSPITITLKTTVRNEVNISKTIIYGTYTLKW